MPRIFMRRLLLAAALLLPVTMLAGCDTGPSGRHKLEGNVTYQGNPVPRGEITFEPDGAQGNSGPGTMLRFENGKYTTGDMGVVGGPHIIRIRGFDGVPDGDNADGKPLFPPQELRVDLPRENAKHDFTLPAPGQGA